MKTKEIREMSGSDLDAKLAGLKERTFQPAFSNGDGTTGKPHEDP